MDWSVLTDPNANLGDEARTELAKLDSGARKALSQELGTIVNKKLEETIRPWFARGMHDWADVDVCAAEMRGGALVLHFIADHYNYNFAQSGSDWADHYVFAGEAHLVGGKRKHETFALERHVHLNEHESEGYVRRKVIDAVRAELRTKLRGTTPGKAAVEQTVDDVHPAYAEWERRMAAGAQCGKALAREKAIEHYEAAVKLAEGWGSRNVYLGRAFIQLESAHGQFRTRDTSLLTRALANLEESLPADHPEVTATVGALAQGWFSKGDHAEPERLLKRFLPTLERTCGLLHEGTTQLIRDLGYALMHQHKHAEAAQLYDCWLQAAEEAWGPDNLCVIAMIEFKAENLRLEGNTAEAVALYSRALNVRDRLDPGGWRVEALLETLGTLHADLGRYEEAEKLLRRYWAMTSPAANMRGAHALANLLRRTGREQEAEQVESDELTELYKLLRGD